MKIAYETRTLVDYSFKLGYLFSVTVSDLREIIILIKKKDFSNVLNLMEKDFLIRFDLIEKYFQKLFKHDGINEDEFNDVKKFCEDSNLLIKEIINEIKNTKSLTEQKIELIEKLLKDLLDN
jgi:hypothetical protein